MKISIFLLVMFILSYNIASSQATKITIDSLLYDKDLITNMHYGTFLEFLNDFINGENGLWAQELKNRGFDISENNKAKYWITQTSNGISSDKISLIDGGYNKNGRYFVRISNSQDKSISYIQTPVYLYKDIHSDFYIYMKQNTKIQVSATLQITDISSNEILFSYDIPKLTNDWMKYDILIPALNVNRVNLKILLEGAGELDIDEASLMPTNNIDGIKKEYYDIFERWKPGIIRYPGGGFADFKNAKWIYGIGERDQRKSPIGYWGNQEQRLDFGTDEFIAFCKKINAEPHIVVNLDNGTAEEAANWVAYCNADTNHPMGKLRSKNGSVQPYNVKYWEIGNEQWYNATEMSKKYLPFYLAMKAQDSTIQCMVDGDIWQGKKFFDDIYDVIGENNEFYSYHTFSPATPQETCSDEELYWASVGAGETIEWELNAIRSWIKERDLTGKVFAAASELLLSYNIQPGWIDTNWRNSSLEAGIWMAGAMNSFLRNRDIIKIVEKTFGLNHIRGGYNSNGERVIYPSPIHLILEFFALNNGKFHIPLKVESPKFNTKLIKGLYQLFDIPMLNVVATAEDKTLYLNVVNRDLNNAMECEINLPFEFENKICKISELKGHYLDFNSAENPNKVKFVYRDGYIPKVYTFPANSYTSIAIPLDKNISNVDSFGLEKINIYPNPSNDFLFVENIQNENENFRIEIRDMLGSLILKLESKDEITKLDIRSLSIGYYFISIIDTKGQKMSKTFVKY